MVLFASIFDKGYLICIIFSTNNIWYIYRLTNFLLKYLSNQENRKKWLQLTVFLFFPFDAIVTAKVDKWSRDIER
jgi:hypothetical protein